MLKIRMITSRVPISVFFPAFFSRAFFLYSLERHRFQPRAVSAHHTVMCHESLLLVSQTNRVVALFPQVYSDLHSLITHMTNDHSSSPLTSHTLEKQIVNPNR